jgi:two-component system sensor histidine kinase AtoS
VLVAVIAMAFAFALTTHLTRSLRALASGADAVAAGDFERRVVDSGNDEVGSVARSFNAMTAHLRRTLADLAAKEGLSAVGSFAAELAHEVRNPLTAIRLDLQMVEERLPEGSAEREIQRQAREEMDRLDRTVSGALTVARSGRVEMRELQLEEPIESAVRVVGPIFEGTGVRLEENWQVLRSTLVRGDPDALQRVLVNILLNAAEAMEPGGTATLTARAADNHVFISVSDEGIGIAEELVERAGEAFYTTKPTGTGLGLAIARRIAEAHGGELRIERREEEGTCVSLVLPSPETSR